MDKLIFLAFTINILVLFSGAASQDPCKPETPTCAAIGDPVPDMCDCSKYYVCLSTSGELSDTSFSCPPEAPYFDPLQPGCGNDPSVCPTPAPGSCPVTCADLEAGAAGAIVDPTDCSNYYICDGTSPDPIGPVLCDTEKPWFNGVECGTDQERCCAGSSALCDPYCDADDVGKQIIDPLDCTKYYICLAEGPPSELYHNSCPSGQNFNITSGHCEADAPCITLCIPTNAGGLTTSSGDCQDTMTCTQEGSFPKCTSCQKQYFHCPSSQGEAYVMECPGDYVFNTDSSYPYCVLPSDCPHIE